MSAELFRTVVPVLSSEKKISYNAPVMLLGSCFTENMGNKLLWYKFPAVVNPFGIVYNPVSIKSSLDRLLEGRKYSKAEIHNDKGLFFSFDHHSKFSDTDINACLEKINTSYTIASETLQKASILFLTFGTAYYYTLKSSGRGVSNCHKLPQNMFDHSRLEVEDIVNAYSELIPSLLKQNPGLHIIFTVSPIRHWKDGAHENQLSKSVLLLSIEKICREFKNTSYFPAYELMLDELRDYRFYEEDMLHPNKQAVEFIWKRFSDSLIEHDTLRVMNEVDKIQLAKQHRPFNSNTDAFQSFVSQQLSKIEQLSQQYSNIDFSSENQHFRSLKD
jgi:hypothetical protein